MNPQSGIKSPSDNKPQIALTELHQKIDAGVKTAIAKAIERHRKLGESISIWQDGKVVTLTADQIPPLKSDNS
ncbi:hypothetical protein [Kamptonema sp. UHCC 0994]|uniref:hypothetical protein n=1 Tax=Kamptonema sp. UHCC 0994 TaxID=3031329 RepID=UPI0023B90D1F|nr:hypothetical protein [Kamptonema sp. UHCC 0994]MDF0554730.1 hypothetical protein [Kamptonema sp. UHCC 0994]